MNSRKYSVAMIIAIVFTLVPAAFVFIVDPLQLYHSQVSLKKEKYFEEQRHQNLGLINKFINRSNENYNTIIMGTSMSENFVPSKFEARLSNGDKVLKLAMSGGRPLEQFTLINKALESGKVNRVIWDLHWYFFLKSTNQKDKNHEFPYALYSNNEFIRLKYYLFNEDYIKYSYQVFTGKVNWSKWTENLDKLNYRDDKWEKDGLYTSFSSESNRIKLNDEIRKCDYFIPDLETIDNKMEGKKYDNIDRYIVNVVKNNPNVHFDIYFPPYTTYFYKTLEQEDAITYIYARKYAVKKMEEFNNVSLYGFDNDFDIVNDIRNYKDYGHFRSRVSDFIMNNILDDKNKLDKTNVDKYLTGMINNINSYNSVEWNQVRLNSSR